VEPDAVAEGDDAAKAAVSVLPEHSGDRAEQAVHKGAVGGRRCTSSRQTVDHADADED
jgi:hypothetical protein